MTDEELDQLALDVAYTFPPIRLYTQEEYAIEFARRYRAALKEKMEPVGFWDGTHCNPRFSAEFDSAGIGKSGVPLYLLENWK